LKINFNQQNCHPLQVVARGGEPQGHSPCWANGYKLYS